MKTTADGRLIVSAKHEEKSEARRKCLTVSALFMNPSCFVQKFMKIFFSRRFQDRQALREFKRMMRLPDAVNTDDMTSRINKDGILTVSVPLDLESAVEEERESLEVKIEHEQHPPKSATS